jgi:tRNA (cytidine32/uridine32-2'-O)-methyltransferase
LSFIQKVYLPANDIPDSKMALNNIKIILVNTSHPGNIGSAARAMKTMGLSQLVLVNPKKYPHLSAVELSAGADDVLHKAQVVDTLEEAIADCQLILGTSTRPRGIALTGLNPRQAGLLVANHKKANVAILFGREYAGLTNDELLTCQYHITIPANPNYSSLNLAASVQVLCYELRMSLIETPTLLPLEQQEYASAKEVEWFYQHLETVLISIDFLKPSNPRRLMQRLRRMFNRIRIERLEMNILRGILSNIQKAIKQVK